MKFLFLIAFASFAGVYLALTKPAYSSLLLIAGPCAIAVVVLLLWRLPRSQQKVSNRPVIIDGSNVMYWRNDTPELETVMEVINLIRERGYRPGVMFDANAGYLVSHKYRHDDFFAKQLGLTRRDVMVVPKGTPADQFILQAGRDQNALIVTNDRFRDWADDFPEITEPGYLNKGGFRSGKLWLALPPFEPPEAQP